MTASNTELDTRTLGFATTPEHPEPVDLEVEGTLPAWLRGTLLRNGPAHFGAGRTALRHWFDGLAMVHRFALDDGRISYSSRFLDTPNKRALADRGELTYPEFATDPCRSLFQRLVTIFSPERRPNQNTSVNIVPIGGRLAGLTETPMPVEFDPETLATAGVVDYEDHLRANLTTAHPHVHPRSGDLVNYLVRFSRRSSYTIYRQPADSLTREIVAVVDVDKPSYMHSFALTENHAVLVEFPLVVDPLSFVFRNRPFIENYRWRPERGTTLHVVDLASGRVRRVQTTEPIFAFHHVNAFEVVGAEETVLRIDLAAYPDTRVMEAFYLDHLRSGGPVPRPALVRLDVDLAAGTVEHRTVAEVGVELPRIDPTREGRSYRYVYGATSSSEPSFLDRLAKIDLQTGATLVWAEPGLHPGEPVFVPTPDREENREDDGVLLVVALDTSTSTSVLIVLDAASMTELARARTPCAMPFGFHGAFLQR